MIMAILVAAFWAELIEELLTAEVDEQILIAMVVMLSRTITPQEQAAAADAKTMIDRKNWRLDNFPFTILVDIMLAFSVRYDVGPEMQSVLFLGQWKC